MSTHGSTTTQDVLTKHTQTSTQKLALRGHITLDVTAPQWVPTRTPTVHWRAKGKAVGGPKAPQEDHKQEVFRQAIIRVPHFAVDGRQPLRKTCRAVPHCEEELRLPSPGGTLGDRRVVGSPEDTPSRGALAPLFSSASVRPHKINDCL